MTSFLSSLNPFVKFPKYHGPYEVGTVDVEVPASDLPIPSERPEGAAPTISFRIFYPCKKPANGEPSRPVRWIPQPQQPTIRAFASFIGVKNPRWASLISYMPQQLYYISLPAHRNAEILEAPTSTNKWPIAVFSHGLAGSRNAYSYVCGDLASQGMVVVALDHRDGSSPIQYVRATSSSVAHTVNPVRISHEPTDEVYKARDKQLRIRLWEISVVYEALLKINNGVALENLDINASTKRQERVEVLWQFENKLDVRDGKVTWAGHSFGAATTVQLLKSIYYRKDRPANAQLPLIAPNQDAAIVQQITPESPMLLLDMWGLPVKSPDQKWLWEKPLPTYAIGGPNGKNVLSILSEAFFNWGDNLGINKHSVAAPTISRRPSVAPRLERPPGQLLPEWAKFKREGSPSRDSGYVSGNRSMRSLTRQRSRASGLTTPSQAHSQRSQSRQPADAPSNSNNSNEPESDGPHLFFVVASQHFNQSDFGLLFARIAKIVTKAEDPEYVMELNNRAMAQVLRESGIEVAGKQDKEILDKDAELPKWVHIPIEDEPGSPEVIQRITRKLSVISSKSGFPSPRDGMTMGMKTEAQLPRLDLPDPAIA